MTVGELLDMLRDYPADTPVKIGIAYCEATLEIGGTTNPNGQFVLILDRASAIGPPPSLRLPQEPDADHDEMAERYIEYHASRSTP